MIEKKGLTEVLQKRLLDALEEVGAVSKGGNQGRTGKPRVGKCALQAKSRGDEVGLELMKMSRHEDRLYGRWEVLAQLSCTMERDLARGGRKHEPHGIRAIV